jgi:guanylate kinase
MNIDSNSASIDDNPSSGYKISRRGLIFILSGPSGAGKSTLVRNILAIDNHIHNSVSATTRNKRASEKDGIDYHFIDNVEFKKRVNEHQFLEYAEILGNYYGTPRTSVEKFLESGEDVIFDIDWQGHRQMVATAREDVVSVFILPPSKEELLRRLNFRNQDSAESIKQRTEEANSEISHWHEYDYVIINRNIESSLNKVLAILRAERLKRRRRQGLIPFVQGLIQQDIS